MVDETLQAAFEIKTACDEISRKLLRWHWEQKPGPTAWMPCSSTWPSARKKARITTTECRT